MSDVAKEKHAEFLLKFSSNLFAAFFITILIGPLSVILSQSLGAETVTLLSFSHKLLQVLSGWQGITFIIFEVATWYVASNTQDKAYDIYNALYPNKPIAIKIIGDRLD
jgi:hypothetical protein